MNSVTLVLKALTANVPKHWALYLTHSEAKDAADMIKASSHLEVEYEKYKQLYENARDYLKVLRARIVAQMAVVEAARNLQANPDYKKWIESMTAQYDKGDHQCEPWDYCHQMLEEALIDHDWEKP